MAKTTKRVHAPSADPDARAVGMSLCCIPGSDLAEDAAEITCRLCEQMLARAEKARIARERAEKEARLAHARAELAKVTRPAAPLTRLEEGLPVLGPDTYASRECTCGECAVCLMFHDLALESGERRHGMKSPHRWTSVTAALEAYVLLKADGYSSGKSATSAFVEIERLGCLIQGGTVDPMRRSHHEASEIAVIERTLETAFADHPIGVARAAAILLYRIVGTEVVHKGKLRQTIQRVVIEEAELAERFGVDELDVRSIVRKGRRALTVELAAREWIPAPREGERAYPDFLRRADALEETRVA